MHLGNAVLLRSLELRLLRCSLPSDNPHGRHHPTNPRRPLLPIFPPLLPPKRPLNSSPASQALFSNLQFDSSDSAYRFYSETLPDCVSSFLNINDNEDSVESQWNWMEWEAWAHKELMSVGSDLCAKFSNLQSYARALSFFLSRFFPHFPISNNLTPRIFSCSSFHFESAAEMSNYNFFVSGALGFRTLHQTALSCCWNKWWRYVCASGYDSSITDNPQLHQHSETYEASDVLMTPRFVEDERHSKSAVHQAVILAQCLYIEKNALLLRKTIWEMAPYIEAIDSQNLSPFILQCYCNIVRARWESSRSRTKQRVLLMMEKLVEGMYNHSPGVAQRLYYCFGVNMPSIPALRKEYGDLLVSCGLIGEPIKIYEDLELWDNLIYCYQSMDKKAAAVELIKKRLSEKPSDSRLWCSLGDVTNDDASYEKALECEKSKLQWETAMGLNSMHPDGWFALGAAALKSRDVNKPLDSFTRAVQLAPENGEAWNNIACLHMIKKRSKEAFIAFKEALKLKRDSWQMWENYSHVSADIGNISQAMEAVQKVLDMTKMKRIDSELLERIINHADPINVDSNVATANETRGLEVDSARSRETEHLIELHGKILRQIGLYARWHKLKGDLTMCSEVLVKQVRSYQGSDLWKDRDWFVKFAHASLELCKVYQELALRGTSHGELFAAEMHLKSTINQAVNFFDTEEFRELVACLEDVQGALKAISLPGV
ncbi:hypothetical protein Pfo_016399 [Paulownia fortunei]|nr:hypothetical protein Pfo_016399 [Paulownia fortunei]